MTWWPFKRRRRSEAAQAAARELQRAEAKDPEVNWLAQRLREVRESDEFARLLRETFGDRR